MVHFPAMFADTGTGTRVMFKRRARYRGSIPFDPDGCCNCNGTCTRPGKRFYKKRQFEAMAQSK